MNIHKHNYGHYSSDNYGAHTMRIRIDNFAMYYSYDTIVAFSSPDVGFRRLKNRWGPTTGKHLNWLGGKGCILPESEFDKLFVQEYAKAVVREAANYPREFAQHFHKMMKERMMEAAGAKEAV